MPILLLLLSLPLLALLQLLPMLLLQLLLRFLLEMLQLIPGHAPVHHPGLERARDVHAQLGAGRRGLDGRVQAVLL